MFKLPMPVKTYECPDILTELPKDELLCSGAKADSEEAGGRGVFIAYIYYDSLLISAFDPIQKS
jgi:hypothetical protein